jgi:hypothetical protein
VTKQKNPSEKHKKSNIGDKTQRQAPPSTIVSMEKDSSASNASASRSSMSSLRSSTSTISLGAKKPSKVKAASTVSLNTSGVSEGTRYPPYLHGGIRRTLAQVNAFFTSVEKEIKELLLRNKHVNADFSGKLSFVEFCISDHANEDVGVLVKVSLARVLPNAFIDAIKEIDYYIKGDDYFSICTFRENGLDTVKEYEMLVLERLQRCMSAEFVEGIIEEVKESMSRYSDQAQKHKNSVSILEWRKNAILMIDEKIKSEMRPDSDSNYLPGAMLHDASTHEEKQNLLLNMLVLGAVKLVYPKEVLEKFGVSCLEVRDYVQQNYYGLLLLVRSLFSDLERAGSVRFRDDVIDQAKEALNMEHLDFERLLEEEDIDLPDGQDNENLVAEEGASAEEIFEGNANAATQAVHYDGILLDAVEGLRSLQGANLLLSAPEESFEDEATRVLRDDSTQAIVSPDLLYSAFSNESAETQALTLETSPQDNSERVLCAPIGEDIRCPSVEDRNESKNKKQKNR